MKTYKPLSSISYNSLGFLALKLADLKKNGFAQFYAFIPHKAEDANEKDHTHLYLEPAKAIDTTWLCNQFLEVDKEHPSKFLKCITFRPSKFADWYWYGLHDKAYLQSKYETRKYAYKREQVVASDNDELNELIMRNPCPVSEIMRGNDLLKKGYTPPQVAKMLNTPLRNLKSVTEALNILLWSEKGLDAPKKKPIYDDYGVFLDNSEDKKE